MSGIKKIEAVIDGKIERFLSRKLLVWLVTTALLFLDKINGDQWISIALGYISIQGVADIAVKWKSAGIINQQREP